MMQLPGKPGRSGKQEFVLERSFVPAANPNVLTAFIVARSDGANYGQLVLYDTPDNQDIPSPSKAATNIDSNTDISKQLSLLDQHGSQVVRGDVQLIPIGDSILYVRPIYVETTAGRHVPALQVRRGHLRRALGAVALDPRRDQRAVRIRHDAPPGQRRPAGNPTPPPVDRARSRSLLARAQTEFDAADTPR